MAGAREEGATGFEEGRLTTSTRSSLSTAGVPCVTGSIVFIAVEMPALPLQAARPEKATFPLLECAIPLSAFLLPRLQAMGHLKPLFLAQDFEQDFWAFKGEEAFKAMCDRVLPAPMLIMNDFVFYYVLCFEGRAHCRLVIIELADSQADLVNLCRLWPRG